MADRNPGTLGSSGVDVDRDLRFIVSIPARGQRCGVDGTLHQQPIANVGDGYDDGDWIHHRMLAPVQRRTQRWGSDAQEALCRRQDCEGAGLVSKIRDAGGDRALFVAAAVAVQDFRPVGRRLSRSLASLRNGGRDRKEHPVLLGGFAGGLVRKAGPADRG